MPAKTQSTMKSPILTILLTAATIATASGQPSLTVYNGNFAVVRDSIDLDLKAGVNVVRYSAATAALEPQSVILRDPTGALQFRIIEQGYRNDPADEKLLLKLFEGQEIEFEVDMGDGKKSIVKGKIIRAGDPTPIIEIEGRLRFGLPGRPWFTSLGDNSILQPTLTWQLQSVAEGKGKAELAYVTGGLNWNADYNLVLPEKGQTFDLTAWISVQNQSGKTFTDANLKLMAGDVRKIQPPGRPEFARRAMLAGAMAADPGVTEKTFDDFHLYSIGRPVTLLDKETKQVEFARASNVKSERFYVYDGSGFASFGAPMPYFGEADYGGSEGNKKVATYIEFKNTQDNQLGIALPKGRVRFYRADGDQLQFIGEAEMDHTPKDELLRFQTGFAFDLVGERTRKNFTRARNRDEATESFEISLRNRKDEPVEIRVIEHLMRWANWEITESSHEHQKINAQRIEFRVPLNAGEEKTLTYTVRYTW